MDTVKTPPTENSPLGIYKVIAPTGAFWGYYSVFKNWCGDIGVRKIDSIEAERRASGKCAPFYPTAGY